MRVNGYRCDVCCKEHLLEPMMVPMHATHGMPVGWFVLYPGNYEHGKEPLLFCSVECLSQWASKQIVAVIEVALRSDKELNEAKPWEDW